MYLVSLNLQRHNKSMYMRCVQVFDNFVLYLGHEHESFSTATNKKRKKNEPKKVKPRLSLFGGWGLFGVLGDHLQVGHKSLGILDF